MKTKVYYDDTFKAKFGADSVNKARVIMAQAQNMLMWKDSLTTQIILKIDGNIENVPVKIRADDPSM
jgi:hypothetical protein